ncbi:MAG: hypothetical protein ABUS54_12270 [Actinomycetota bacterium]
MSSYDDDNLQFDFFDEPETVETTQRRRLPRLDRGGGGDDRPPRVPRTPGGGGGGGGAPTGVVPLVRLVGLIAIAIAIVVGLVFWVGSCQGKSKHDTYASYAAQVRTIRDADKQLGVKLVSALQTKLKASDLETSLAQFAQQEQQEYTQAQAVRPPGPLRAAHQRLLDAIELRAKGLAGMSDVLARAGANATKTSATQNATATALAGQGMLLTSSDVVWAQLYQQPATQMLKQQGVTGVVIPTSQFLPTPDDVSSRAFTIVMQHLAGASTGGAPSGLHGDSLVGVHVSPQGADLSASSATTIQVSADLAFTVTAENSGDFTEVGVPVTLKIDSGSVHIKRTETISSISPKQQQSVTFQNFDLPPDAFANRVTITATIEKVPGETKLDNNSASYPVFFTLSG